MSKAKKVKIFALIVAGGKGLRMESSVRKQYLDLLGLPVLVHTLKRFSTYLDIDAMVLVVPNQDMTFCRDTILVPHGLGNSIKLVAGGNDRQGSVRNGLLKLKEFADAVKDEAENCLVMIHDGVRPFVDHDMMDRCLKASRDHGAAIPVVSVKDSLVKGDHNGFSMENIDRNSLFQVQTPQCFDLDLVLMAHDHALETKVTGTDDASLVRHLGHRVFMTQGNSRNIKITTRDDLFLARAIANLESSLSQQGQ